MRPYGGCKILPPLGFPGKVNVVGIGHDLMELPLIGEMGAFDLTV
jgi:hypothetical protein